MCRDATELEERTRELLETPVGSLFGGNGSAVSSPSRPDDDRDAAYSLAHESAELVEYLLRGYNRTVSPLALYSGSSGSSNKAAEADPDRASASLETMMDVMERFHREGEMYLRLRREALEYNAAAANPDSSSSDGSSSSSSSSSDSSTVEPGDDFSSRRDDNLDADDPRFSSFVEDKRKVDDAGNPETRQQLLGITDDDFAMPGVTTAMYDTVLDAMACATQVLIEAPSSSSSSKNASFLRALEPDDLYRVAGAAWKAHDLNNRHNAPGGMYFSPTVPTMVTYNAALRGIGNLCGLATTPGGKDDDDAEQQQQPPDETTAAARRMMIVDQGLAHGFAVYNHLTHNDHGLPKRNAASIVYLLEIIRACIPTSRVRGNMTVALWHQASREGLVTPELVRTIRQLHDDSNGPEFEIFLESLDGCCTTSVSNGGDGAAPVITPQRFARFAKKHRHSRFY